MGPVRSKEFNKSSALSQWRPLPNARSYPADCLRPEDSLVNLSCSYLPTVFTEPGFLSVNKMDQIWVGCHGDCIRSLWALYLPLLTSSVQWTPCGMWVPPSINLWNHLPKNVKFVTKRWPVCKGTAFLATPSGTWLSDGSLSILWF